VSTKKKNQHFVPRHYLKRFSFDGGRRVRLFNLTNQLFVPEASLKNQCSSSYFYGEDPGFENALAGLEGDAESLFRQVCDQRDIPKSQSARKKLIVTMALMHVRTERAVGPMNEMFEATLKNSMRIQYKMTGKELPDGLDLVRIKDPATPRRLIMSFLDRYQTVADLEFRLVVAPRAKAFITSDHPVVLMNQAFFHVVKNGSINGFASKGLQLLLPISPELLLIAFDRSLYRVGTPNRTVVKLNRSEDCDLINALQIINAEQNVYFHTSTDAEQVRSSLRKFDRVRSKARESEKASTLMIGGDSPRSFVMSGGLRVPVPGKWSFCKVRKSVGLQDFGVRNPELLNLFEEHASEMKRTGRQIAFRQWLQERRAKALLQKSTSRNQPIPPG
jgi:Protein of unknown function (DUF4238)